MSCILTETTLVEGVDYELDLVNGRIRFKSSGLLGPDLAALLAGGGCGVQVDFCGSTPLRIPCENKIASCLPCDDDPVLNISAEDEDVDRFLFNFNTRTRPRLGFTFENVGCKRKCTSEVSQFEADLCAVLQVTECINDGFRDETGPTIGSVPPFRVPQSPALFFNSAQTCTTFCPDGNSFGATIAAGLVANGNQLQANRIAFSLACRLSAMQRVCIRTTSLPTACKDSDYSKQLLGSGGTGFRVTFDNFETLAALCAPAMSFPNSTFPYIWSVTGLPTGLSVSPCSGRITGIPTQAGTFSVTLRAQDSLGSFQTKTLSLTVVEITNDSELPDAMPGVAYSHGLAINPAGTYFFQFFSGAPPDWLSLNPNTGQLTGTPDLPGNFLFEISVEASDGTVCRKEFTLLVGTIPTPTEYWSFNGSTQVGEILGEFIGGIDFAYAPGKVDVGNILTTSTPTGFVGDFNNPAFNFVGDKIVVSLWFKEVTKPTLTGTHDLFTADFYDGATYKGSVFVRILPSDTIVLIVFDEFSNSDTALAAYDPGTTDFHLMVLSYSRATGLASVRIDNAVILQTVVPIMVGVTTTNTTFFAVKTGASILEAGSFVFDEWAMWMNNTEFSQAQFDALWNGGTGRFWPF